jgi:hypothetical protein
MKSFYILTINLFIISYASSQNNTYPYPQTGWLGIGDPNPNFNIQIFGTEDYLAPIYGSDNNYNYGKTARLGLTTPDTGPQQTDGLLIRMSRLDGAIENLENGNIQINTGEAKMLFSGHRQRIWFPDYINTNNGGMYEPNNAYVNIVPSATGDNGLFIKTFSAGNYGISVQPRAVASNAFQVVGNDGNTQSFSVQGNGSVSARKLMVSDNLTFPAILNSARINVSSNDNGLFIKNNTDGKYGVSVQTKLVTDNAFQAVETNGTTQSFSVQGNGSVSARRIAVSDYLSFPSTLIEAMANIQTNDNGLYVKSLTRGKYGISVSVSTASNAIQVLANELGLTNNFMVHGNGNVAIGSVQAMSSRLLITNQYYTSSIEIDHTQNSINNQKMLSLKYLSPTTEILTASDSTGLVTHLFQSNGKTTIHNGTRKIFQLETDGVLKVRKLMVDEVNWPDYVLENDYKLLSLKELASFIKAKGHLPNMPSREEILKNGVDVGQVVNILTEKVEELTLYLIEHEKTLEEQKEQIEKQQLQIEEQQKLNEEQLKLIEKQQEVIETLLLQLKK